MISDLTKDMEKRKAIEAEEKRVIHSLLGKCYEYRESYDDRHLSFIRVVLVSDSTFVDIHRFQKHYSGMSDTTIARFDESSENFRSILNMTEIPLDEFENKVSEYLKLMGLQFTPGYLN